MKEETLEEASEKYCFTSFKWPLNKSGEKVEIPPGQSVPNGYTKHSKVVKKAFLEGALWQAKRSYSKEQMLLFGGFCSGKLKLNPQMRGAELWEAWEESFKS